jgi:molecular chaperone GrpE (heat shock protein)
MLKKGVIFGLVLIVAGSSILGYLFGVQRKEQQQVIAFRDKHASQFQDYLNRYNQWLETPLEKRDALPWGLDEAGNTLSRAQLKIEQQERLGADLEKLAAGERDIYPFADQLYGKDWRIKLQAYKQQKELREMASVASVVCASLGGFIVVFSLVSMMGHRIFKRFSPAFQSLFCFYEKLFKCENKKNVDETKGSQQQERILKKRIKTLSNSGWNALKPNGQNPSETTLDESTKPVEVEKVEVCLEKKSSSETVSSLGPSINDEQNFEGLTEPGDSGFQEQQSGLGQTSEPSFQIDNKFKTEDWTSSDSSGDGQLALSIQQATAGNPNELSDTLKQLTQQVSAIREYASDQQAKVQKLQAGYDWKIIKSFSLRVIRCIDNLESRINQLRSEGIDTVCLEEVRDELLFALESSGIEQFIPEVKSEYRGLEKTTEVVKEKEPAKKSKMKGRIAKVIRPGYQYCLNEDKRKVVRTAQVKLYG